MIVVFDMTIIFSFVVHIYILLYINVYCVFVWSGDLENMTLGYEKMTSNDK
jgi:hypothetical protein